MVLEFLWHYQEEDCVRGGVSGFSEEEEYRFRAQKSYTGWLVARKFLVCREYPLGSQKSIDQIPNHWNEVVSKFIRMNELSIYQ